MNGTSTFLFRRPSCRASRIIVIVSPLTLAIKESVFYAAVKCLLLNICYVIEALHTCFVLQWDDDDLFELLSVMCAQNAAQKMWRNTTNQL